MVGRSVKYAYSTTACYFKIGKSLKEKVKRSKRGNIRIAVAERYLKLSDASFFSVPRAVLKPGYKLTSGNFRFFDIPLTSFDIPFTYLFLLVAWTVTRAAGNFIPKVFLHTLECATQIQFHFLLPTFLNHKYFGIKDTSLLPIVNIST